MSFEAWLAFAAASTVLLVIPGPTVLLRAENSLTVTPHGWLDIAIPPRAG